MNIGLKFRDLFSGRLGQAILNELDNILSGIIAHWEVEHKEDGTHGDVTVDSLAVAGDVTVDGRVTAEAFYGPGIGVTDIPETSIANGTLLARVADNETVTGAWTFSTVPVLGALSGYLKGTAGAVSAQSTPLPVGDLGTGTPDNTKFLRGDGAWAIPAGASLGDGDYGDVSVASGVITIDADVVTNAKLAEVATQTLKGRKTAATGNPEDFKISDLTEESTPTTGDWLLAEESGGNLRKVNVGNLPTGSGVTTLDGLTDVTITTVAGGDVLRYYGTGGYWENVPGYVHRDSGRLYFDTAGGTQKTANYTATVDDFLIGFYSGSSLTLTLYAVSGNYARALWVVNSHPSGTVTIDPNSTELIDNASTKVLPALSAVLIWCDGLSWTTIATTATVTHVHAAADITSGTIATARLGSGSASSSTYLRGDQTWATPAAGFLPSQDWMRPLATGTSAIATLADGTSYAICVGRLQAAATSVVVGYHVSTAIGSGVSYQEIAIGKSTNPATGALPTITPVGYATANFTLGSKATTVSVSGGQTLAAGDWLWIIFAQSATGTNPQMTGMSPWWSINVAATKSSFQPSTGIGTAQTFTASSAYNTNSPMGCAFPS